MIFKLSRLKYILLKFLIFFTTLTALDNHRGHPPFIAIQPEERPEGSPVRIKKMKGGVRTQRGTRHYRGEFPR